MRRPGGPVYLLGRAATPGAAETQQFLSRNGVEFRWIDGDDDPLVRLLGADGVPTDVRLPCVLFADGSLLEGPERFMRTRFVAHQGTTPPVSPEDQQAHLETKRFKHESGHFRFHVVGERILHLDTRLFYKHRGLERAAEGKTLEGGLAFASRACAACAVTNGVAYAHACEDALGLKPTAELARARTILLELERMWSHLNDIAAVCAGVGLAAGNNAFAALTERSRRLNAALTGHRFLFGSVRVGGSDLTLDHGTVRDARQEVGALRTDSSRAWRELLFNASFQDRLPEIGVVTAPVAERLGAVGPAARASGLADDVRATSPRLAYEEFEPVVPKRAAGDVQARLEQRALELLQTFALLEALLEDPVAPAVAEPGGDERSIGVGRVESPRGATSCVVERRDDRIERLRLRTGSYANWPVVAQAAVDDLLPDFPLINKSFELCYACADR